MRTVIETAEAVRRGELKAVEALDECLALIEAMDPELNAFSHLAPDLARAAAERVDAMVARGEDPGPFAGVPFGVKDLEDCAGMPTGHGSLLYAGHPPAAADSMQVARLRAAGAVPLGKTTAPEFGATCFTATKACGVTRNPWDPTRTPGGSSGGSAAAASAGMVPFATASDGGGSTRIPAAFTGLLGLKPSYGRIPFDGAHESETSVRGAMVTTVADAARHLDVTAGPDDRDRGSLPPSGVCYERAIEELDVGGLTATWSLDLGFAVVDPEVAELARAAADTLVSVAGLREIDRPFAPTNTLRVMVGATQAQPGGFAGVDVFFAISGFLITSLLLREAERDGRVSLSGFWARRARRILPAALLTILAGAIATIVLVPLTQWQQFLGEMRASTAYVQNWQLAGDAVDYLASANAPSPVQHYWSLSIEEQFYLVWPVLIAVALVATRGRQAAPRRRLVALVLATATALSLLYSMLDTAADPAAAYFVTPTRAWELGAGALLALAGPFGRSPTFARAVLSWLGLAAIVVAALTYSGATPFPGYAALLPVLGALAVIRAGAPAWRLAPTRLMAFAPVQRLGDISYSVYLCHWPLIILGR